MTKRVYPFAESFSSQYKIHVGQKELNYHGVFGNKYRQEIYEKTRNLLFNGTKAVMGKIWNIDTEKCSATQPSGPGMTSDVSQTLLRGQTLIGQDGRLQRTTPVQGAVSAPAGCCVCQKAQGTRRPCSQCDRPACPSCIQQCASCSSSCCSVCTVIEYTF
ncbi:apoptosis regulatory protein Siva isoform X4 [Coregonus clupeaformis]|uniref:apoptosis regulatory protein Siva isoform X4 n=1 Tax=Coregonus clupeaformis TaxID=59861 RepID=UPI001E1C9452|nr:apoptosis regulatory protein Siva isoform X4 [Coregonus clupeaformis]